MNKIFLSIFLCFLITVNIVFSAMIEIDINEDIKIKKIYENIRTSFNFVNFTTEIYNIGTIGYNARARVFIYDNNKTIFNGWSQEKVLMPGEKKTFNVYWYSPFSSNYYSKLRLYFGNEIFDDDKNEFEISKILVPEDIFEIIDFRTYDDHVIFSIKSKKDAKSIVIIPNKYITGWIFEQKTLDEMKKDSIKTVSIPYHPTYWKSTNISLAITAENGRFYSENTVEMKKDGGLSSIFYSILDSLRLLL